MLTTHGGGLEDVMTVGMTKVLHVKLPVTDLQSSVDWYAALMDLRLTHEFIEDNELRGAALRSDEGRFSFALRLREHCAGQPSLDGFDIVALHMADRDALVGIVDRCQRLGVTCSVVQDRSEHEAVVDVTDPDGTVLRFYWVDESADREPFVGMIFDGDNPPRFTSEPRLRSPVITDTQ
jgi:catechol 2,3-dioxygenase-like lactoylglutathione lyase family enzyme